MACTARSALSLSLSLSLPLCVCVRERERERVASVSLSVFVCPRVALALQRARAPWGLGVAASLSGGTLLRGESASERASEQTVMSDDRGRWARSLPAGIMHHGSTTRG
jgi:hypothetical protein